MVQQLSENECPVRIVVVPRRQQALRAARTGRIQDRADRNPVFVGDYRQHSRGREPELKLFAVVHV